MDYTYSILYSEFQTWLMQFSPETIVGSPCNTEECPLATWFTHRGWIVVNVDNTSVHVGYTNVQFIPGNSDFGPECDYQRIPLPPWASTFVDRIDKLCYKTINVQQCLGILYTITE